MTERAGAATAATIAAAVLVVWLATGQRLFHGYDAYYYLQHVAAGDLHYWLHAFYLPVAWAWSRLLALAGIELYEAMRALSAVAAALGVFACHRAAARLQLGGERAAMAALGAASLPAVAHAATVVEIDAITFCGLAMAWVPFASLVRELRWRHAVAVGVCTGLTAGFHAAGHLGAAGLCALLLGWRWRSGTWRADVAHAIAIAATHFAVITFANFATGTGGQGTMATNTFGLGMPWARLPGTALAELLLPYAPLCLVAFAAVVRRETRGAALVLFACVAVHLTIANAVIADASRLTKYSPQGGTERGSFFLALAPCFVLLAVRTAPRTLSWTAIALGAVSSGVQIARADWPPDPPGYAAGWATVTGAAGECTLFADAQEWAWVARRHPHVRAKLLDELRVQREEFTLRTGLPVTAETIVVWFGAESHGQRAAGRELFVSERALEAMRRSPEPAVADAVARLATAYELRRHAAGGFVAWTLHPR